jgi:hypothetical protein
VGRNPENTEEVIGYVITTLAAIIEQSSVCCEEKLLSTDDENPRGTLAVKCETIKNSNKMLQTVLRWDDGGNVKIGCCGTTVKNVKFQVSRK